MHVRGVEYSYSCLRSQNYEFESNSQQNQDERTCIQCCLRSQNYEFESNSQHIHDRPA